MDDEDAALRLWREPDAIRPDGGVAAADAATRQERAAPLLERDAGAGDGRARTECCGALILATRPYQCVHEYESSLT